AWLLFAESHSQICADCPANAFELTRNDGLADSILQTQRTVGVVLSLFTVALLVRRWRRAGTPERRAGAPVLWAGGAMFAELAYWVPVSGRYVDDGGAPVQLPEAGGERAATVVERDGEPIAALIHDSALAENDELVRSVCAAAGLTLENARLQAELRARLAELQASRARLVEATDTERRRIERDLHDGTQQRRSEEHTSE